MEAIAIIGFLVFSGSLVYLVYHFIRKIMNRERTLKKKIFYPILAGGFILFFIGAIFWDTTLIVELDEAKEAKVSLTKNNETVLNEKEELEIDTEKLKEDIVNISEEIEELESKLPELEKKEKEFNKLESVHKEDATALEEEISTLKTTNSSLKDKVDDLK